MIFQDFHLSLQEIPQVPNSECGWSRSFDLLAGPIQWTNGQRGTRLNIDWIIRFLCCWGFRSLRLRTLRGCQQANLRRSKRLILMWHGRLPMRRSHFSMLFCLFQHGSWRKVFRQTSTSAYLGPVSLLHSNELTWRWVLTRNSPQAAIGSQTTGAERGRLLF